MRCLPGCLRAQCSVTLHLTSEQQHIARDYVSDEDHNAAVVLAVYETKYNTMFPETAFNL